MPAQRSLPQPVSPDHGYNTRLRSRTAAIQATRGAPTRTVGQTPRRRPQKRGDVGENAPVSPPVIVYEPSVHSADADEDEDADGDEDADYADSEGESLWDATTDEDGDSEMQDEDETDTEDGVLSQAAAAPAPIAVAPPSQPQPTPRKAGLKREPAFLGEPSKPMQRRGLQMEPTLILEPETLPVHSRRSSDGYDQVDTFIFRSGDPQKPIARQYLNDSGDLVTEFLNVEMDVFEILEAVRIRKSGDNRSIKQEDITLLSATN